MTDTIDLKNVTKFDGTNFQLWKFQMKIIFTASGLLDVVDGTLPKPEPTADNYAAWNSKMPRRCAFYRQQWNIHSLNI